MSLSRRTGTVSDLKSNRCGFDSHSGNELFLFRRSGNKNAMFFATTQLLIILLHNIYEAVVVEEHKRATVDDSCGFESQSTEPNI